MYKGVDEVKRQFEKNTLKFLYVACILSFLPLIRRKPTEEMNEWIIIFLVKSYISSLLDTIVNKKGFVKYPVNLTKYFNISVLFSYLLFPLTCVYFNQITKNSNIIGILIKAIFFSAPMAIIEDFLEKNTKLVKYHKGWNSIISFISITSTFLLSRGIIAIIRLTNKVTTKNSP